MIAATSSVVHSLRFTRCGLDEWLFETKCGEVVCCALGGTDKYSMPYIVYETPTAYVLIIPNNPSVYSLQAIAWNMDFTQFR